MFCRDRLRTYRVTLHLDGRHPYLDPDYGFDKETQDVVVTISAKSWSHAEKTALMISDLPEHWRRSVKGIERV